MKIILFFLLLFFTLTAHSIEYRVNLFAEVPSEFTLELIDSGGTPLPFYSSIMLEQSETNVYKTYQLNTRGLFAGTQLKTNTQGIVFKVTRTLSPLVSEAKNLENFIGSTIYTAVNSNCNEDASSFASTLGPDNISIQSQSSITEGRLCGTNIYHHFKSPIRAGLYNSEFILAIGPLL
ncbi:hypothetical protein [Vibrio antiquarius]|uniref:hypothetical protein n=1 Tax=Vibrio antiquarius (strain Ex25) TaxID=150340 RepID=UPI002659542A|nr:hypothetical protein [Vibrio antiquarius]MCR9845946.1 hypothetical protein [Vibrio antiquarius]MCR9911424.1 hypothetical protein [Vibrio antiquarius]